MEPVGENEASEAPSLLPKESTGGLTVRWTDAFLPSHFFLWTLALPRLDFPAQPTHNTAASATAT